MAGAVDTQEERKQRKAEKKEKKRLEAASTEPANEEPAVIETEEERKARKAAKKEKKRKATEQAEQSTEQPVAAVEPVLENVNKKRKTESVAPSSNQPIKKNFYVAHPATVALTDAEVKAFRAEHEIAINEVDECIKPITSFEHATFPSAMLEVTKTFKQPSAIQSQCWPVLLSGRDCISIAETGSGKTLGFLLPGLVHIMAQKPVLAMHEAKKKGVLDSGAAGPIMLILSPTRELATQTKEVCDAASKTVNLRSACIYGGVDKYEQKTALEPGVHTIVATPGRLLALIEMGVISLKRVSYLVLDEADRMLDMGFEPDIRAIIGHCATPQPTYMHRQTLMFSATWPPQIQQLAHSFIHNPVQVNIGGRGEDELKANHRVAQKVIVLENDKDKFAQLRTLIKQIKIGKTQKLLVFVLYKKEIDVVERFLHQQGQTCVVLSSDRNQAQRFAAIESFKTGEAPVLVATDVAARGLDINGVTTVINFTFPLTVEDYVHRIGRTGRGGSTGSSFTFFTKAEKHLSGELINVMKEAGAEVPDSLLKFGTAVKRKEHGMYGAHFKSSSSDQPMKAAVKVKFDD